MSKRSPASALAIAVGCLVWLPGAASAQDQSPLAGAWTLNKSLSELPREIGFNINWLPPSGDSGQQSGSSGGRGRRGSSGGNRSSGVPNSMPRESSEDARRLQFVTGEARNPPTRLMIVDTPAAVTITNELGQSRTLHPSGKQESLEIQGIPFSAATARDGDRLVTVYN